MFTIRNNIKIMNFANLNVLKKLIDVKSTTRFVSFQSTNYLLKNKDETADEIMVKEASLVNKENLPTIIPASFFEKIKEALGFQGGLNYPQPVLTLASFNLYLCIQYQIDFDKFYTKLNYPDVFYSYCLINFFHIWMASVPLMHHGRSGLYVRKLLQQNMWKDIEARAKKLEASMTRQNKIKTYTTLNDEFKSLLFALDEGLLSDDTVLAGAIWRHLLSMKDIQDYSILVELCDYIRKNVQHLEKITENDLLRNGIISFVDFEQKELDHSKVRLKLMERIRQRKKEE